MSRNKKVKNPNSAPKQSRTFTMLAYPEWPYLNNILSQIQKEKYALAVHDKDIEEETGELKKPHIHIVIEYGGRRTLTAVQNEYKKIGMESRFIDTCNERVMIRYLIHKDDPDKYQYQPGIIDSNMKDVVELALTDTVTSATAFYRLNEYIRNSDGYVTQTEINQYAIQNGLLGGLKTYGYHINGARMEHNQEHLKNHNVSDMVDREQVHEHVKENNRYKKAEQLVDMFGATTIEEEDGKTYTLTNAKVKTSKNEDKTDIWDGLDMVPNTSGGKNNGKA